MYISLKLLQDKHIYPSSYSIEGCNFGYWSLIFNITGLEAVGIANNNQNSATIIGLRSFNNTTQN